MLHRDIKIENIVISHNIDTPISATPISSTPISAIPISAHLIDFGLSCTLTKGDPFTCVSVTGSAVGTLHYMSPENLQSASKIHMVQSTDASLASDVFSLGATFYSVITDKLVYPELKGWQFPVLLQGLETIQLTDWCASRGVDAIDQALFDKLKMLINRMISIEAATRPSMDTVVSDLRNSWMDFIGYQLVSEQR